MPIEIDLIMECGVHFPEVVVQVLVWMATFSRRRAHIEIAGAPAAPPDRT